MAEISVHMIRGLNEYLYTINGICSVYSPPGVANIAPLLEGTPIYECIII